METLLLGSTGPNVKLIQSLLNRIGYSAGAVDGAFGSRTRQAVIQFQQDYGLTPDGVVGPATWAAMERLLLGYDDYNVRPGDTVYAIARRFYTTENAILTANPGINPNNLYIGQHLTVPYGIDVVYTDIDYTYDILSRQLRGLRARYPFLEVSSIGTSVMGKSLYAVRLGRGTNQVFYNAAHHANEWITTPLLMKFIENVSRAFSVGGRLGNYSIPDIWSRTSIYIVPMVNPDGVDLVNYWPNYSADAYRQAAQLNRTGLPLPSVWKANIRGTDLNLNYPAEWERGRQYELEQGITGPGPRDYGGPGPLSEPETVSMANFTRQHDFRLVIAYHTQGNVIFYQFENLEPPESTTIAQLFSRVSGYAIAANPEEASYAGYKDWFIQEYRRPGFTIEVGLGVNPVPVSQFPTIYSQNEEILLLGALV
ncbi:g-D-glutamyl-meso-diaminopimelate peptidase [Sporobacter termitidis DSM 10068]|uniref:G-D-glutamyl-meso-diaminopimelate peptidase n=1 Tax=Sporobacter termitidis DSM 10068 TaxID=1123282 RepID=A0A1M5WWJ8_9FIRM|nr:M14 family metallopeptidase [Sporobacter termitidis]SHH91323.1 g-D-glutamyl-meso-diaminopimelate peptidase [Sporobacter termitidis DSM 10068]